MRHVLLVVSCVAVLLGVRFSTPAKAQPPAQRERWEYAWLTYSGEDSLPFAWKRGGSAKEDPHDPIAELVKTATTPQYTFSVILDEAGKSGWELVSVGTGRDFYFKRRVI